MQKKAAPNPANPTNPEDLINRCLAAFIHAGTLDLSLDQLAARVGTSKRMLVHYFGGREAMEEQAMTLLEDRLRAQFAPENFPRGVDVATVLKALWRQTTDPSSRGVLRLVMDVSRRAWNGSDPAVAFYQEQQRLWTQLLLQYLPDKNAVDDILQSFQGAVLAYLITGDAKPGTRMLRRLSGPRQERKTTGKLRKSRR